MAALEQQTRRHRHLCLGPLAVRRDLDDPPDRRGVEVVAGRTLRGAVEHLGDVDRPVVPDSDTGGGGQALPHALHLAGPGVQLVDAAGPRNLGAQGAHVDASVRVGDACRDGVAPDSPWVGLAARLEARRDVLDRRWDEEGADVPGVRVDPEHVVAAAVGDEEATPELGHRERVGQGVVGLLVRVELLLAVGVPLQLVLQQVGEHLGLVGLQVGAQHRRGLERPRRRCAGLVGPAERRVDVVATGRHAGDAGGIREDHALLTEAVDLGDLPRGVLRDHEPAAEAGEAEGIVETRGDHLGDAG